MLFLNVRMGAFVGHEVEGVLEMSDVKSKMLICLSFGMIMN